MTSQSLQFNILNFTHPSEKLTFYFTNTEADAFSGFMLKQFPKDIVPPAPARLYRVVK